MACIKLLRQSKSKNKYNKKYQAKIYNMSSQMVDDRGGGAVDLVDDEAVGALEVNSIDILRMSPNLSLILLGVLRHVLTFRSLVLKLSLK